MKDIKLFKAITKGALTFLPGFGLILKRKKKKSKHSGSDALFCYILWFRILCMLKANNLPIKYGNIAEIGTGGSLGMAFCALLSGSEHYSTLDIEDNFDSEANLSLFDEIVRLFSNNKPVLSDYKEENINVRDCKLNSYTDIINPNDLISFLSPERIGQIRNSIILRDDRFTKAHTNWEEEKNPQLNFEFIFSRAVMEHVTNPLSVYFASNKILKIGGIILHDIEFHSHGITDKWDTHTSINENLWRIIFGRRKYYLNRYQYSDHLKFIKQSGFSILDENIVKRTTKDGSSKIYGAAIIGQKSEQVFNY